jgi:tetratricopeptide (TPR) repeat protein
LPHHFISYSAVDALDIAMSLAAALEGGDPSIGVWLDKLEKDRHRLRPGEAWDEQIVEGIRACDTLVFLLTPDSVHPNSVCKNEWTRALKYKKPIIPIRVERGVEMPFRLDPREAIELGRSFEKGIDRLRNHLVWLKSPAGVLRTLEERLADADRDLRRAADDQDRQRILDDMATLKQQIAHQREAVEKPGAVAQRIQDSVAEGIEQERQPAPAIVGKPRCQVVNVPPGTVPSYFQDRHVETKLLSDLIARPETRLVFVVGRGGVGKTSFTCRLLKAVETGQALEGHPPPVAEAIVYLSSAGARRVSVPNLYADLCRLLPPARAQELMAAYANPVQTTTAKMEALLQEFQDRHVLVLLDNFEDLVDPERLVVREAELADAITAVLYAPPHAITVVVTTRLAPRDLLMEQPGRQARIELDEGLPSPFAENILREMDVDGKLGLKTASDALLNEARVRTRGYPRALEALFAILSADRDTTLADVLGDTQGLMPEHVVRVLVGEAFCRLDLAAQQVQQALAIYDRPVLPAAVDHLLQPHLMGVSSAPILGRLVNMQFVRKQEGRYYLHPVDREYAMRRIPRGQPDDRTAEPAVYSQLALLHRGAEYFLAARPDSSSWKSLDDLGMLLAEFDMRCDGEDFERAYAVLYTFEYYLQLWGQYRLSRELAVRLEGHLQDPVMRMTVARTIGGADSRLGRYPDAIRWLEQSLAIARELQNTEEESYTLYQVGWCHGELGDTAKAVEFGESSLRIAEANGYTGAQGDTLSILGWYYGKLGQVEQSVDFCGRAVELLRDTSSANSVATALSNVAGVLLDAERYEESIARARESLATDPDSINLRNWNHGFMARAWLGLGKLAEARATAEEGRKADEPENNPNVLVLLGIACLRLGDRDAAAEAFAAAAAQAEAVLQFAANYNALDSKGVALSGLALCGDPSRVTAAAHAHHAARRINRDAGVVRRVVWLYEQMAPADADQKLDAVRIAAGGAGVV